jgi:hypothetical protein
MEHCIDTKKFWLDIVDRRTPRGALQAAEFEARKFGSLVAKGKSVTYIDALTGVTLLSFTYCSGKEAKAQLGFFRAAYNDVEHRRAALHVV